MRKLDTQPPSGRSRLGIALAGLLIALAGVIVYWNSFHAPFVFDGLEAIVENHTIRRLWPLSDVLFATRGIATVEARPLLNLSFALNYACGGLDVWGYHVVNLMVHILAGLALFGIVRRTMLLPEFRERASRAATPVSAVTALLWVVHPLQTESVTYVVQRAESLHGLVYLLTLYLAIRSFTSDRPRGWQLATVTTCALGMAVKEVMVSAPLIVLLYDRLMIGGSFRTILARRWKFHAALALTWGVLVACLLQTGGHSSSAGFGQGVDWKEYALTQCGAILHYLRLVFWPTPLVLDYGTALSTAPMQVIPGAIAIGLLVLATLIALRRQPWVGFTGIVFWATLAPSSSVVPIATQTMAEHRMYLPLACVLVLVVVGGHQLGSRLLRQLPAGGRLRIGAAAAIPTIAAITGLLLLGSLSVARNSDYRSALVLWQDTTAKRPANTRSHTNLAMALHDEHRFDEAITEYTEALRLSPGNYQAFNGLGVTEYETGKVDEAITHYRQSLASNPNYDRAYNNLGSALNDQGRAVEAIANYRKALEISPNYAKAHDNLGNALVKRGQWDEAIRHLEEAVRLDPDNAVAHNNLGNALCQKGRVDEAMIHYRRALEIKPDYANAANNLGQVLLQKGMVPQAIAQFEKTLELNPAQVNTLNKLAWIMATDPDATVRNGTRAVQLAEEAAKRSGGSLKIVATLAAAYAEAGRFTDALTVSRRAQALARQQSNAALAGELTAQIAEYEKGQPFRDTRTTTGLAPPTGPAGAD